MSNDNKTLADAQPGGMVRLGDQTLSTSEGARRYVADFFAKQLRRHGFCDYILTELAADFACTLAQHLSAHPSPGGQDALATARELLSAEYDKAGEKVFADRARKGRYDNDPDVRAIVAALSARQPSKQPDSVALGEATEFCIEKGDRQLVRQEPVAYGVPDGKGGVKFGKGWAFTKQAEPSLGSTMPLYATAQAVDLGAVRESVQRISLGFNGDLPYIKGITEALALIDGKAVSNG